MSGADPQRVRSAAGARLAVAREVAEMVSTMVIRPPAGARSKPASVMALPSFAAPDPACSGDLTPVVLVPGYGGGRSSWRPLQDALSRAGFARVAPASYDALIDGVPGIAARLVEHCAAAMAEAGADRVHLIGHSLGGVVVRYAVSHLGLSAWTGCAVTIAAPHRGTAVARLGRGPAAAGVRRGSTLLAQLAAPPPHDPVRWVAYYSNLDVVVPARSARLDDPALRARNIRIPDEGHVSILRAPALLASVVSELAACRTPPAGSAALLQLAG